MIPKIKLFVREITRDKILTRGNLRRIGININGDYPFCENQLKDIDHLS